ncbi:kinase-like domain-containing protein [Rhizophagus irregularis DAOM 181602=DAOM 197198]|nr:kinase-like domain-containing protein [Rhizophagus irregularis DAOM 181602=DAOM 197198]
MLTYHFNVCNKCGEEYTDTDETLWNNGSLHYDSNQEELIRKPNTNVVLKCLNNSQNIINIIDEFLIEANTCHDEIYGLSQNPDTKDYIIVLQDIYCEKCGEQYSDRYSSKYNKWYIIDELLSKAEKYNKLLYNRYDRLDRLHELYGISQNPDTEEYIIVQDKYCEKCAIWNDNPLYYNSIKEEVIRKPKKVTLITLNYLNKSQNMIDDFLNKVKDILMVNNYKVYDSFYKKYYSLICGISQNPDTGNYIIVSQDEYCEKCTIWKNGPLHTSKEWIRSSYANVVLKSLDINEFSSKVDNYNDIYGISQNPDTKEYIMVLSTNAYCEKCGKVGDNTAVYSAIWKNGPLYYRKKWIRKSNEKVVLNYLTLDIKEFFNKVDNYEYIYGISQHPDTKNYFIVLNDKKSLDIEEFFNKANEYNSIYGISQNPNTNDYILVLQNRNCKRCAIWKNGPSYYRTKSWIRNSYKKVVLKCLTLDINEFFIEVNNYIDICGISQDPNTNDYILVFQNDQYCNRCCKPYNNSHNITDEFLNEIKAYSIMRCWDSNPDNRPNAELISKMLTSIKLDEILKAEKYLFKDYKENNQLTTTHPQAVYTSRLLNPYTESLAIDFTELDDEK